MILRPRLLLAAAATGAALLSESSHAFTTTPSPLSSSAPILTRQSTFGPTSRTATVTSPPKTTDATSSSLSMSSTASGNPALALYEKYRDSLPSQKVIEACDGQKAVVASDLAAKAGISVNQAQRDLTLLASLSQGDIAVSTDGDLIYSFPSNLDGVLSQKNSQYKLQQTFRKIWPTLFWGIRVSFGLALVASLVAIYSSIFFIQTSSSSSSDDRDDRRGGGMGGGGFGGGFNYFWGPSPFDFFYYRPYGYYGYYGADSVARDPEELGFFESVYSYVFGDGDPNQRLEERRLSLAAQMIRSNDGAVTAEQLAPYCDPELTPEDALKSNFVDESFVLPIVTQLNGEPTVTEDGDIVYLFPELQTTTSKKSSSSSSGTSLSSLVSNNAMILKRAGLDPNASSQDIQLMLNYNGISTRGVYDKQDLIRILEKALPPLTAEEQDELEREADLSDPTLLAEREIPFSVATDFNKILSGGLGIVNLGGALFLGNKIAQITAAGYTLPGIYGTIASAYPLLLGYAVLFNVIPLVRNFWIKRQNEQIAQRNSNRKRWRQALKSSMSTLLSRKLKAAKALSLKQKRLGSSQRDILYDTASTTMEDLGKQKETIDLSAFDKLLEEDGSDGDGSNKNKGGGAFE